VEGLKRGEIQALVAQNPKKMGREAVQALIAIMKGETVPAVIDTGSLFGDGTPRVGCFGAFL
jgi:ribose transport system substrate-binding protein